MQWPPRVSTFLTYASVRDRQDTLSHLTADVDITAQTDHN